MLCVTGASPCEAGGWKLDRHAIVGEWQGFTTVATRVIVLRIGRDGAVVAGESVSSTPPITNLYKGRLLEAAAGKVRIDVQEVGNPNIHLSFWLKGTLFSYGSVEDPRRGRLVGTVELTSEANVSSTFDVAFFVQPGGYIAHLGRLLTQAERQLATVNMPQK